MSFVAQVVAKADALATAASTYTVSFGAAIPAGDFLVVAVNTTIGGAGGQTGITITDTKGNTYTQRVLQDVYSTGNKSANGTLALLTCPVTAALTTADTFTVTSGGGTLTRWLITADQYTGITGVDVQASTQAGSSSAASGLTGTPTQATQVVVGSVAFTDTSGTVTTASLSGTATSAKLSTYPVNSSAPRAIQSWYSDQTAQTARSASATLSPSEPWACAVLALNEAPLESIHGAYVWNGTQFVRSVQHIWNGSSWDPYDVAPGG